MAAEGGNGKGAVRPSGARSYPDFSAPTVDEVMVEERAAALGKRSIKKETKVAGLLLSIAMMDLTTLEGKDSPGKVTQLCQKAMRPHASPEVPPCAAICWLLPEREKCGSMAAGSVELPTIKSTAMAAVVRQLDRASPSRSFRKSGIGVSFPCDR